MEPSRYRCVHCHAQRKAHRASAAAERHAAAETVSEGLVAFESGGEDMTTPCGIRVYYDPPIVPAQLKSADLADSDALQFVAAIADTKAAVMIDTGASEYFITGTFCKRTGLKLEKCKEAIVTLGDGRTISTKHNVRGKDAGARRWCDNTLPRAPSAARICRNSWSHLGCAPMWWC